MGIKKIFHAALCVVCIALFSGCPYTGPIISINGEMLCYGGEADLTITITENSIPVENAECSVTFDDTEYDVPNSELGVDYYVNLPEPAPEEDIHFSITYGDIIIDEIITKPSNPVITPLGVEDASQPITVEWQAPVDPVDAIDIRIPAVNTLDGEEYIEPVDDPTDTSLTILKNTFKSEDSVFVFVVLINQSGLSGPGIKSGSLLSIRISGTSEEFDTNP